MPKKEEMVWMYKIKKTCQEKEWQQVPESDVNRMKARGWRVGQPDEVTSGK